MSRIIALENFNNTINQALQIIVEQKAPGWEFCRAHIKTKYLKFDEYMAKHQIKYKLEVLQQLLKFL